MSNKDKNTLDLNAELEERRIVPLMLPDDFDTPRDLDERIIREMAQLSRELDEKNRQREERKAHVKRFFDKSGRNRRRACDNCFHNAFAQLCRKRFGRREKLDQRYFL